MRIEEAIDIVLQQQKQRLAQSTYFAQKPYLHRLQSLADVLSISTPCQELYNAFIADDNGSINRRKIHTHCVKLIDAVANTHATDERGIPYNEPPLPSEVEAMQYFARMRYPLAGDVSIDHLIMKAQIEMKYLNLTSSTTGQYMHAWMDIRRFFYKAGTLHYSETCLQEFIKEIDRRRRDGSMHEWKWKINRKAAHVLIEVASTGRYVWKAISKGICCSGAEIEAIRLELNEMLAHKNLSQATISLYDYVFRKAVEIVGIETKAALMQISAIDVQYIITQLANTCNSRSMSTLLPILRSTVETLYAHGWIENNIAGVVVGAYVQRGNVSAYLCENDIIKFLRALDTEDMRTKAMLLLALKLGLRVCDICNLKFEEIDWYKDQIRIIQKKTGRPLILPLLPAVGNALMDYILNERPHRNDEYPYVFLRKQAPFNKLKKIYFICSKMMHKLDIHPINGLAKGPHVLRYSMVHRLLTAQTPHQVITDILGHTSKEADKPYLSMEETMLRMCALDLSVIGSISWKEAANG